MKTVSMKLSDIKTAYYNPRKMSKKAEEQLKASMSRWGLLQPIIVNKRNNRVVGGNQRLNVLLQSDETHTDVVLVDLPDEEEKALNIALNKVSGDWDEDKLQGMLSELYNAQYDIPLTGFDITDIKSVEVPTTTVTEHQRVTKPVVACQKHGEDAELHCQLRVGHSGPHSCTVEWE